MRQTDNLGLALYEAADKMNITGAENSLNHNMELIDKACSAYVTPEMFGAAGDGITNDTGAIEKAMAAGLPVVFTRNKSYRVTGFTISRNITLIGNGATLLCSGKPQGTKGAFVFFIAKNEEGTETLYDVSITGFHIDILNHIVGVFSGYQGRSLDFSYCYIEGNANNDPGISAMDSPGANQGICFYHFERFSVTHNVINNIRGYAISAEEYNTNGVISDNVINNTGRGSIYVRAYNKNVEVTRNTITNSVRCFTVVDGCIDLYGPGNENIYVNKNYISGYGREASQGCGMRIKGSKHVVSAENTVIVDNTTNSFALILTQDRDGVGNEDVVIEKNNLWCFGAKSGYMIRDDQDPNIVETKTKGLTIRGNRLITDSGMAIVGISIRRGIDGLSILDNHIEGNKNPIEFYPADDFDRDNVLISGNRIFGSNVTAVFQKINDLRFVNNCIQADKESGALVSAVNCSRVLVDANTIINQSGMDILTKDNCTQFNVTGTNTFITKDGVIDLKEYAFVRQTSGYADLTFEAAENGIIALSIYGRTEQDGAEEISPENLVEYQSVNDEKDLTVTINGNVLTDSCVKRGLPVTDKDLANYTDENGQDWISDYRDWGSGVDWHVVEEYELTGEEDVRDYSDTTITVRWPELEGDKKSVGSTTHRYKYKMLSNAFKYGLNSTGMAVANDNGNAFSISSYNSYFTNAEGFKAMCKSLYDAGTPIKILYLLQTPYTTPIDPEELALYKQRKIQGESITVENNKGLFTEVSYLIQDDYVKGAKKLINDSMDNFTNTQTLEVLTSIVASEVQNGYTIRTNNTTVYRNEYYKLAIFNASDLISNEMYITYSVSSDIVNIPAFVVRDADGNAIDVVLCETDVAGSYTGRYTLPENASEIYVNVRAGADAEKILRCITYEKHSKFGECVREYAYGKEQIDAALKSYITDVASIIGGDA